MTIKNGLGLGGVLASTLAIMALVGCGSSGGSSATGGSGGAGSGNTGGTTGGGNTSGSFTTSVPSGTKLTGLTSAQATTLCNDVNSYFKNHLGPDICKETGLAGALELTFTNSSPTDAQLQAACTAAYNACLTGDGGFSSNSNCDPTMLVSSPSTCTATVGDATTCVNAETTAANQATASIPSCATLTAASLAATANADAGTSGGSEPASCMVLDSCNVSMGSSTGSGSN